MIHYPSGSAATHRKQINTQTSAGVPITFAGSPALALHKAGDSAGSPLGTAVTLSVDFDGVTGRHDFSLPLTGLADGTYSVVVSAGTVNGTSVVGAIVDEFSIGLNIAADVRQVAGTSQTAGDLAALLTTIAGYIDTEVAAVKAQTDKLTFNGSNELAASLSATVLAAIADKLLGRSIEGGADGGRTVASALTAGRGKLVLDYNALTMTVYKADGSTIAFTGPILVDSNGRITQFAPTT